MSTSTEPHAPPADVPAKKGPSGAFIALVTVILIVGGAIIYIELTNPVLFERLLVSGGFQSVFLATEKEGGKFILPTDTVVIPDGYSPMKPGWKTTETSAVAPGDTVPRPDTATNISTK